MPDAGPPPAAPHLPTPRSVWVVCGVMWAATVLNYLDRQVLSLTAEHVMREYDLTQEGFGRLVAAFRYTYGFCQLAGGWLVDALGSRAVYPAAVAAWSMAGVATAFSGSLAGLTTCRATLGAAEAFNWPAALHVTSRIVSARDRALANGIFNSGAAAGAVLAPLVVTALTVAYGWRAAFLVTGLLGAVWVVAWRRVSDPFRDRLGPTPLRPGARRAAFASVLRARRFWGLLGAAIIVNGVNYFLADWIPLYLKLERGFGFIAGNALAMAVFGGLEVGNIGAGWLVRHLTGRGASMEAARWSTLVLSCILMSFAAGAGVVTHAGLAWMCLVSTGVGVGSFLVIYLTLVQDVAPTHVGLTAGLLGGAGNLAYGAVSPLIGGMADAQQSSVTLALVGALPWAGLALLVWAERRGGQR